MNKLITAAAAAMITAAGSSGSGASSASGGGSGSGSSGAMMAQIPGFSTLNADQIISSCQSSPDKQLSEVIGAGGASAQ